MEDCFLLRSFRKFYPLGFCPWAVSSYDLLGGRFGYFFSARGRGRGVQGVGGGGGFSSLLKIPGGGFVSQESRGVEEQGGCLRGFFFGGGGLYCDTIAAIPHIGDTFSGRLALPQNGAIPSPWFLVSHRHICAIPHFATYRAIIVRYPTKTGTKEFCDTIVASIARYAKYRYWASKLVPFVIQVLFSGLPSFDSFLRAVRGALLNRIGISPTIYRAQDPEAPKSLKKRLARGVSDPPTPDPGKVQ